MKKAEVIERLAAQNSSSKAESDRIFETPLEAASSAANERAHLARACEIHAAAARNGSQGCE